MTDIQMVTVNGKQLDIIGKNFGEYLIECGCDRNRIATERRLKMVC
ncbi:MAG: hypothetical protein IJP18_00335 [Oscillospiraceae bacterium]|nr:hypothetical protein [Oscillospiraceae bacterium]